MRKVAVFLYIGAIAEVEEYLDVKTFKTDRDNIMDTEYVQAMDILLARNGLERDFFFRTIGPINNIFYVDFGSYTYFIEVRFFDNMNDVPINKIEVSLYEGSMSYINEYFDIEYILTEHNNLTDINFEPIVRNLLYRNQMVATKFVCEYNARDDALYIDFGSPNYFTVVRFVNKIKEEKIL